MPDLKEIRSLPVENELHTCPDCGYERGFHTSFVSIRAGSKNPVKSTHDVYRAILICPECGARYDVGWRVSFDGFMSSSRTLPSYPSPCVPHGSPAACLPASPHHEKPMPE